MPIPAWLAPGLQRELDELPRPERERILSTLRGLPDSPIASRDVEMLRGTGVPNSFRVRIGRHRVLGAILPDVKIILYTTVFRKKRPADYRSALHRHIRRCAEAGR